MMKEKFIELYNEHIKRPGADKLLEWIISSDFFKAPASTKYHLSRPGGLVEHSINVFERLKQICEDQGRRDERFSNISMETIAICSLLHDLCKANFYVLEMKNKKDDKTGEWGKVPFYVVDDQLPYGHGEKSVYIISAYMKLSREEAMAIRWHMGFSDNEFKAGGYSVGNAFGKYPLALFTHMADLMATSIDETE